MAHWTQQDVSQTNNTAWTWIHGRESGGSIELDAVTQYGDQVESNATEGDTWTTAAGLSAGNAKFVFVESVSPLKKWAVALDGTVQKYSGGAWANSGTTGLTDTAYTIHGVPGDVYVGTISGHVFHTTDGGSNWSEIGDLSLVDNSAVSTLYVVSATDIWTAQSQTLAHWNGSAWTSMKSARGNNDPVPGSGAESFGSIWADATHVYASGNRNGNIHGVWYSSDTGATWTEQSPSLTLAGLYAIHSNGTKVYAVGEACALYGATFGTDDWALETDVPTVGTLVVGAGIAYDPTFSDFRYFNGVFVAADDTAYVVGTYHFSHNHFGGDPGFDVDVYYPVIISTATAAPATNTLTANSNAVVQAELSAGAGASAVVDAGNFAAFPIDEHTIYVVFTQSAPDPALATKPERWSIDNGLYVQSVTYKTDFGYILHTTKQVTGTVYTITF